MKQIFKNICLLSILAMIGVATEGEAAWFGRSKTEQPNPGLNRNESAEIALLQKKIQVLESQKDAINESGEDPQVKKSELLSINTAINRLNNQIGMIKTKGANRNQYRQQVKQTGFFDFSKRRQIKADYRNQKKDINQKISNYGYVPPTPLLPAE